MRMTRRRSGARGPLIGDGRLEPAPNSVHLVDEGGRVVCGAVYPSLLTRLDRPWSEWMVLYRCRRCHELHPMD